MQSPASMDGIIDSESRGSVVESSQPFHVPSDKSMLTSIRGQYHIYSLEFCARRYKLACSSARNNHV